MKQGQEVDYIPNVGIAKGLRLHGYIIHTIESNDTALIYKDGNGPLDQTPFRVFLHQIRPTIECPRKMAERRAKMARERASVRRSAAHLGLEVVGKIEFSSHGARVRAISTHFIPYTDNTTFAC